MKKTGINDIAMYLDLSRNTVSKVMNGRGKVSDSMRAQIIEAAIKLEYDKLPEHLLVEYEEYEKNKTPKEVVNKNILVLAIAPDFSSFWGKMIGGITKELADKGYYCLYNFLTFEQAGHFTMPELIKSGNIAGIVVINMYNKQAVGEIATWGIPTVYYDLPLGMNCVRAKADVIIVEGRDSIFEITKGLLQQDIKPLGFIGDANYCKSIEERWRGFIRAHEKLNRPIEEDYCIISQEKGHFYFEQEVERALQDMLTHKGKLPRGFICANDVIAYKAMNELRRIGYRVPEDIKISGFDDIEVAISEEKSLTSVGVCIEEIGVRLAEQILWRIIHPERNYEVIKICGDIYLRKSTQK